MDGGYLTRRKTEYLLSVVLFRILIDIVYFRSISPRFSYDGLVDCRTTISTATSWIVLAVSYLFMQKILANETVRSSNILITILYFVSFIPFTTCISAGFISTGFLIYNTVYWCMLLFFQNISEMTPIKAFAEIRTGDVTLGEKWIALIGILSLMVIVYISWRYTGFRLTVNLLSVYDLRAEARGYAFPRLLTYMFSWVLAINPVLLGLSLVRRKWGLATLFFAAQMLCFGVNGLKTTFFMPFVVIFAVLASAGDLYPKTKKLLISGLCATMLLAIAEMAVINTTHLTDIIVRRMFFVPNNLGNCYYDYFSVNQPDYFRSSFLRHLGFSSPYTVDGSKGFTYNIGALYFGKPQMNCNNGLSSDAMANLGLFGCLIMPLLLACVLRMLDRSTVNVDQCILITPVLFIAYNLISTTLTTVLLTHGMIILIIIMMIIGNGADAMKRETINNTQQIALNN